MIFQLALDYHLKSSLLSPVIALFFVQKEKNLLDEVEGMELKEIEKRPLDDDLFE